MTSLKLGGSVVRGVDRAVNSGSSVGLTIVDGVVEDGDGDGSITSRGIIEIDLTGDVVLPGLINSHDHLHLNGAPGLRPTRRFDNAVEWFEWLADRTRAAAEEMSGSVGLSAPLDVRLWHGTLKNVLSGATTVAHHDPHHEILDHPAIPIRVVPCGWAHSLGLAGGYGPDLKESWNDTPAGRPWIVHLAEGVDESARAELATLVDAGCVDRRTVVVHAVGIDDEGRRLLLDRGGSVVWCPSSNLEVLGTTLDPRLWFEPDGRLAIGTDSRLTGARDLLREMRVAAVHGGLEAAEVARLVTADAARVLRLEGAGRLDHSSPADLIVLRHQGDPWESLLESDRADLRAVALGGRPVIADPDLEPWFAAFRIEPIRIELDGRRKLADPEVLGPPGAVDLEPGLEVVG